MISFIASYPKSGSTWLRLLFNAYFMGRCNINQIAFTTGDIHPYHYQNVSARPLRELSSTEIVHLRPAALMQIMATWPVNPILVKTHSVNATLDDIPLIPFRMTKRAFYVIRDPRDVAVSYSNHFGVSIFNAIESMGKETNWVGDPDSNFGHEVSSWSNHVNSWLDETKFPVHLVRYEALHERPKEVFANILDRMELEINNDHLNQAIELTDFDKLKDQEKKSGFQEAPKGRKFFKTGKVGYWKEVLSSTQEQRIIDQHGKTMERLGYV